MCVKGMAGFGSGELRFEYRNAFEDSLPRLGSVAEAVILCELIRRGNACAGDSVVEAEHPDPSAVEDVMDGCIVHRIRGLAVGHWLEVFDPADIFKMAVEGLRLREAGKFHLAQTESAMQESARAGGIDDESRGDRQIAPMAGAAELHFSRFGFG